MGLGLIPRQVALRCRAAAAGDAGGPHPAPHSGLPGRFPRSPRLTAAVRRFWGGEGAREVPPPPRRPGRGGWIPTPGCFFLAPRPAAGCFACLSRRDGRAVPPSTKTRGGDGRAPCGPPPAARRPARRGRPVAGGVPRLSCGRGAAAFPTPPRAVGAVFTPRRDAPHGCPGSGCRPCVQTHPPRVHTRVCGDIHRSHRHPPPGRIPTRRCGTPTRVVQA